MRCLVNLGRAFEMHIISSDLLSLFSLSDPHPNDSLSESSDGNSSLESIALALVVSVALVSLLLLVFPVLLVQLLLLGMEAVENIAGRGRIECD